MNQNIITEVVNSFLVTTEGIPIEKAVVADAIKQKITVLDEKGHVEKTIFYDIPDMKLITKSQQKQMMGIVIRLHNAKVITWEGAMGNFEINIETYEYKPIKKK